MKNPVKKNVAKNEYWILDNRLFCKCLISSFFINFEIFGRSGNIKELDKIPSGA